MLPIDHPARDIPTREYFDNRTQEFITVPGRHVNAIHLQLEHSLMSIARWESKWHIPFIGKEKMTPEEFLDYIRCMTINSQKDPDVYKNLEQDDYNKILEYMQDPMSAHEIKPKKNKGKKKKELDTAEAVYCAMTQLGIPFDCDKWHFNRLSALIDYCSENESGGMAGTQNKPRSQKEMMDLYHALNQKNRKKYNSKG